METNRLLRQAQDAAYYTRREAQERSAAAKAHGKARQAHEQMAERYRELAGTAAPLEPVEPVEPVEPAEALEPAAFPSG